MPHTIDEVVTYAQTHPHRQDGTSWASWCEAFVYWAGGFTRSFPTALAAGDASGPLNPDWTMAPRGAIHYWAGAAGDGHVAFELGNNLLLMASLKVTDRWGADMGTVTFNDYKKVGLPYRGWTVRHGTENLTSTTVAATTGLHLLPPFEGENIMKLFWDTDGTGYLMTVNGILALTSMQVYHLLARVINSNQATLRPELFLPLEVQIIRNHLHLLNKQNETGTTVDPDKFAAAVSDALGAKWDPRKDPETVIDLEPLARAINAAIPRIVTAMVDEQGKRLGRTT